MCQKSRNSKIIDRNIDTDVLNKINSSKYEKCSNYKGCGLVKVEIKRCKSCAAQNMYGCIKCKSGYDNHPYIECLKCCGMGEIKL